MSANFQDGKNFSETSVTIYDRSKKIGGLLQTGVPNFKLDKTLLARRQTLLEQVGIRFTLRLSVDDVMLSRLLEQNDAIFLGLGAQTPRSIGLPGEILSGVEQALGWLKRINAGERESLAGQRVLVIGGGDTAMDCARAALRLGAEVSIAYRGPEECLRASPKEITLAQEERARFLLEHQPRQITRSVGAAPPPRNSLGPATGNRREDAAPTTVEFETPEGIQKIKSGRVAITRLVPIWPSTP
ncbi:MAG: hypothetical protein DIZ77_15730 [endosymbiont of Seepiophila jonesi]|uniref:FAD/NAD(P)-binding domain-containing protein n=1 Tax=endosymbiont of Lamellibrachia luymesi TaxID=2200907 RepID=A0A370DQK7_9GAMM|nr:MAG: hypothetical protein DIZ79_15565 [endosymbiont of Lamellibrachia luymesi]RDH89452.1 MAG: hypothetical protein DIZ77_15730 [endosymbiont of Seepiophila jonesi]